MQVRETGGPGVGERFSLSSGGASPELVVEDVPDVGSNDALERPFTTD